MRASLIALATIAALGLAGCGERPSQEMVQKTGKYQGKPDTVPWDNPQFGGKQAEWERAIQARSQNQNEYVRTQ
jgi:hypothetical protein